MAAVSLPGGARLQQTQRGLELSHQGQTTDLPKGVVCSASEDEVVLSYGDLTQSIRADETVVTGDDFSFRVSEHGVEGDFLVTSGGALRSPEWEVAPIVPLEILGLTPAGELPSFEPTKSQTRYPKIGKIARTAATVTGLLALGGSLLAGGAGYLGAAAWIGGLGLGGAGLGFLASKACSKASRAWQEYQHTEGAISTTYRQEVFEPLAPGQSRNLDSEPQEIRFQLPTGGQGEFRFSDGSLSSGGTTTQDVEAEFTDDGVSLSGSGLTQLIRKNGSQTIAGIELDASGRAEQPELQTTSDGSLLLPGVEIVPLIASPLPNSERKTTHHNSYPESPILKKAETHQELGRAAINGPGRHATEPLTKNKVWLRSGYKLESQTGSGVKILPPTGEEALFPEGTLSVSADRVELSTPGQELTLFSDGRVHIHTARGHWNFGGGKHEEESAVDGAQSLLVEPLLPFEAMGLQDVDLSAQMEAAVLGKRKKGELEPGVRPILKALEESDLTLASLELAGDKKLSLTGELESAKGHRIGSFTQTQGTDESETFVTTGRVDTETHKKLATKFDQVRLEALKKAGFDQLIQQCGELEMEGGYRLKPRSKKVTVVGPGGEQWKVKATVSHAPEGLKVGNGSEEIVMSGGQVDWIVDGESRLSDKPKAQGDSESAEVALLPLLPWEALSSKPDRLRKLAVKNAPLSKPLKKALSKWESSPVEALVKALDGTGLETRHLELSLSGKALEVEMKLASPSNEDAGEVEMTFHNGGKPYVYLDLFELEKDQQGQGFAKKFLESAFRAFRESGIEEVQLYAGLTTGGYAWARYGFECDADDLDGVQNEAQGNLDELDVPKKVRKEVEKLLDSDDPRVLWEVADTRTKVKKDGREVPLGSAILRGTDWDGRLKLKKKPWKRFKSYVDGGRDKK